MAKRVPCVFNPNYQRNGTKSYVWLMSKYGFNSTLPGPYFVASRLQTRGKFGEYFAIHKRHDHHSKRHRKYCDCAHQHCPHCGGEMTPPPEPCTPPETDSSSETGTPPETSTPPETGTPSDGTPPPESTPPPETSTPPPETSTPPPDTGSTPAPGTSAPPSPPPDTSDPDPASSAGAAASGQQPASAGSSGAPATGSGTAESSQITAQDIQLDSEYLCPVQIGTPAQTMMLDFDTGSSDLWVWSTELPSNVQQSGKSAGHNIFDSSKSSTFKKLQGYTWQISYGDGSSASGDVGNDVVSLGAVNVNPQAVELANTMSTQFQQGAGDGLLGLAWPSINTIQPTPQPTPVANMISQQDIQQSAELFTAYLGSWRDVNDPDKGDSYYTFGEIDQDALNGQTPAYTPVDNSQGFWMFNSTTATLNGKTLTRPSGNTAIADTGTTLCLVDSNTCKAIYAAIPGSKYDSTQQGYVFPSSTTADQLPDVALACGNNLIHVQKEYLSFADAGNNTVFGGIQDRGSNPFDIYGDVWLKNSYTIFDQGNQRLGVVQRTEPTQNLAPPPAEGGAGS